MPTNIQIATEVHEEVKKLARKRGQKIGWLVNLAVKEFLKREGGKKSNER